mgnify:CR=1 FL=1
MAFEATKKEWSELYSFLRILSDGHVCAGTPSGEICVERPYKVMVVQREEHDGTRRYMIDGENVRIVGDKMDKTVPRACFTSAADLILEALKKAQTDDVTSPDGIEEFLDDIAVYDLEAKTDDRTDYYIGFWDVQAPLVGFRVYSKLSPMIPLLDGGRTANLKFEQTGIKFAAPTVNKINLLETPNEVLDRMRMIERLGGVLKYSDVADKVFRSNLCMIDLHFPRMLAEMVRTMYCEDITRVSELTARIEDINPLKIKDELIRKHGYYKYKMKSFLMALALGMRPAKLFNGSDSAVEGFVFVDGEGRLMCYQKAYKETFADFLFHNTRFLKGPLEKDKYGYLERENGAYYFKLNAKIGFVKR